VSGRSIYSILEPFVRARCRNQTTVPYCDYITREGGGCMNDFGGET
jgi:hypothetical protein